MFGAEGDPGPIERVIRRSEDSNANPRTDKVTRTGVVHVPATRQGGCNTPHGVFGGPADNTITSYNEGREVHPHAELFENFRIVLLPGTLPKCMWREDAGP